MFGARKQSEKLAQVLYKDFVQDISMPAAREFPISVAMRERYEQKVRIYQLAVVLMVLIDKAESIPEVKDVREALEDLVFSKDQGVAQKQLLLVRLAMKDLADSFSCQQKPPSWAYAWFKAISIDTDDIVNLGLFEVGWAEYYSILREFISNPA